jgi:flagellar motor switch protein FliM
LQRSIDVEFVSTEMVKFGDFMKAFGNPTSFNIFNMDPLIGSAMLAIEPGLVFSLIDCMFGGEGKPFNQMREFTLIEQRMARKMALEVLASMETAWKIVYPVSLALKKAETKPEFVHLVNPNELVIVIVFSIKGGEFAGNIHFCISYLMLEPIKEKLCSRYLREKDTEHVWGEHLQNLLRDTEVTLVAELGRTVHTVRDLLGLQIKDILKLNTGPEELIRINIEGVPKFKGFPGIVKGNRAVEISTLLRPKGGMNKDGYRH